MTEEMTDKPLELGMSLQEASLKVLEEQLNMYKAEEAELLQALRKNFRRQNSLEASMSPIKLSIDQSSKGKRKKKSK